MTPIRRLLELTRQRLRAVLASVATDAIEVDADPAEVPTFSIADAIAGTPLGLLFDRFAIGRDEQQVLAVLIAHELCLKSRLIIRDFNTEPVPDPTLDAVRRIVYGPIPTARSWHELGPEGVLRRLGFVEVGEGELPEYRRTLKIGRRVLALAHGDLALDPAVASLGAVFDAPALAELVCDAAAIDQLAAAFDREPGMIVVQGRAGTGRRSLLATLARERGHRVLAIDGHRLDKQPEVATRQLRMIARECRLLDLVPLIGDVDAIALDAVEAELSGLVLATTAVHLARRWKRPTAVIELPALSGVKRAELWSRALPAAGPGDVDVLATLYPLAPALIRAVGAAAIEACGDAAMRPDHIEAGIRAVLDDRLAGLATRLTVTQTWDDLVLPDDQATAVTELLSRIRKRRRVYEDWGFAAKVGKGLGVSALFSGPPGTGKTMVAGLIARELGTELYQVDLSKMSSKWIGETEKNLASLFDAAEGGHAVLLFDEADSLFGKRTEVRTSNDRHANQETNYLLQRLESFAGICILTTNHEAAIDDAFRRRLSIHVRLPVPDLDERRRLWTALLPKAAPVDAELDLDALADKFVMTGGYIRNAVVRAAFLAADDDRAISASHLARAAQLEYEAMGKLVAIAS